MKKVITTILIVLSFACSNNKFQTKSSIDIVKSEMKKTKTTSITNDATTITDELYTLQIRIEKTENNQHNLVIDIKLHNGSHFVSPFEEKEFSGKFYMDLGDYTNLSFDENISETPQAVDSYDKFGNQFVKSVKVNTTYRQQLNIKTKENFEVFGRVQFVIEPRCTLEQIPFAISYKDGKFIFIDPKC